MLKKTVVYFLAFAMLILIACKGTITSNGGNASSTVTSLESGLVSDDSKDTSKEEESSIFGGSSSSEFVSSGQPSSSSEQEQSSQQQSSIENDTSSSTISTSSNQPTASTDSEPTANVPQANTTPLQNQTHTALHYTEYYQYGFLSANEKTAYKRLKDAAENYQNEVDVTDLEIPYSRKSLTRIITCLQEDHPQYFWLGNQYSCVHDGVNFCSFKLLYTDGEVTDSIDGSVKADRTVIAAKRKAFDEKVKEIVSKIGSDWSDYQKEKYIHDYVVNTMEYKKGVKHSYDAYGGIINNVGVCEAYSESFQALCYAVGVNANQVFGNAGGAHKWNVVKLDGEWYMIDVTFDDPIVQDTEGNHIGQQVLRYDYFNLTTAKMTSGADGLVKHTIDLSDGVKVPDCTATKYGPK